MTGETGARIVLIEDQVSYGDAVGLALSITSSMQLVGRSADADEGISLCFALAPDLLVTDYRLPAGRTGTEIAGTLREKGFTRPIVVLTGFVAPQVNREAEALDDVHVLSKDSAIADIIHAFGEILKGVPVATPESAAANALSAGELEVLELLNQGFSPAQIAEQVFLSLHTIRARIKAIHRKLDVTSQVEAIAVATRLGLLVPPS